ncbi:MAG: cytochrome P450 [Solirubrobacterales bacterium]|nr:cytochrome P450 [Solirubrobacterales bacterium]
MTELEADPHPLLHRLRESEPVSWLPALDGWLVTRRDLALAVMRDADAFTVDDPRFSTARVIGPSMLSLDGGEHGRHRDPFARPFRLDATRERFTDVVAEETARLLDGLAPAGRGELRRGLAGPLAATTTIHALGLDEADPAEALGWYEAIVASVTAISAGEPATADGGRGFADLRAAIERSLEDPGQRSLLAAAAGGTGGLSRDEVVSNAAVLLFGGIETTEAMIVNVLLHLLDRPDQLALVRREPTLLEGAVEESLRLEPAAARVDRYATRDLRLADAAIGAGELVIVSIAGANRDPAVFADPDRFDLRRENARLHVAFAAGPHTCIAMHLARLEAHAAVRMVLERLPGLRLDADRTVTPRGLVFRKPGTLHAVWS